MKTTITIKKLNSPIVVVGQVASLVDDVVKLAPQMLKVMLVMLEIVEIVDHMRTVVRNMMHNPMLVVLVVIGDKMGSLRYCIGCHLG